MEGFKFDVQVKICKAARTLKIGCWMIWRQEQNYCSDYTPVKFLNHLKIMKIEISNNFTCSYNFTNKIQLPSSIF